MPTTYKIEKPVSAVCRHQGRGRGWETPKSQRFLSGKDREEIPSMGNHRSRLLWLHFKSKGSATKTHNWEENAAPLIRAVGPPAIYSPTFIKNKNKKEEKSHKKTPISIYHLSPSRSLDVLQTACQMKCIKSCSFPRHQRQGCLAGWSLWIYSEQTAYRLTTCTELPCSKQTELKAPPDQRANGIPYNFLLHQGKP